VESFSQQEDVAFGEYGLKLVPNDFGTEIDNVQSQFSTNANAAVKSAISSRIWWLIAENESEKREWEMVIMILNYY